MNYNKTPAEMTTSRQERRGGRLVTAALASAIGLAALTGCAVQAETVTPSSSNPSTSSSQEGPSIETPNPVETVSAEDQEFIDDHMLERAPMPPELQKYQEMSVEEFQALPNSEQWLYVSWLTSYRDSYEELLSTRTVTEYGEPTDLTPESGGEDVFKDYMTTLSMATYQTGDAGIHVDLEAGTVGALDEADMAKVVSAALGVGAVYDGDPRLTTQRLLDRDYIIGTMTESLGGEAILPMIINRPNFGHAISWLAYGNWYVEQLETKIVEINGTEVSAAYLAVNNEQYYDELEAYMRDHNVSAWSYGAMELAVMPVQNYDGTMTYRAVRVR
jgi:hypothetical protein